MKPPPDAGARPQILALSERLQTSHAYQGRGVTIAFVDSGFYPHPDLLWPTKRIKTYADVTQAKPSPDEFYEPTGASWHGTMTACAACGSGYTSGGHYRGPASGASVVLVRASDREGAIKGKHVASALRFALRHPELAIRVVNVSLGVEPDDPHVADVEAAVRELVAAGIVVIAAAGNDPSEPPQAPASCPEAITVGGQDDANTPESGDDRPWASSHGASKSGVHKPDLIAPAVLLPAPMLPGTRQAREAAALFQLLSVLEEQRSAERFRDKPDDDPSHTALYEAVEARIAAQRFLSPDYQRVEGTSFAAPITAAVVAQMLDANEALTPADVRRGLLETAEPLRGVPKSIQGAGVLRPRDAVEWALREMKR